MTHNSSRVFLIVAMTSENEESIRVLKKLSAPLLQDRQRCFSHKEEDMVHLLETAVEEDSL